MPQSARLIRKRVCTASKTIVPVQHPSIVCEFRESQLQSKLIHQYCAKKKTERCHFSTQIGGRRRKHDQESSQWLSPLSTELKSREIKGVNLAIAEELDRVANTVDWSRVVYHMKNTHGVEGVCETFTRLREQNMTDCILRRSGEARDTVAHAAIQQPANLICLIDTAEHLLFRRDYSWPNLYTSIICELLDQGCFQGAIQAHLRLMANFSPKRQVLELFFQNYVTEPDVALQNTLKIIYISLQRPNFYDVIIPVLFQAGFSILAREWRTTFLLHNDMPVSNSSRPFLRFLSRYHTEIPLNEDELRIANANPTAKDVPLSEPILDPGLKNSETAFETKSSVPNILPASDAPLQSNNGITEKFVAKLFASKWTPVGVAMRLAKNAGVHSIGSHALQALALRQNSAAGVNKLLKELSELEISIPTGAYTIAISAFAEQGEDELLNDLLQSDIHPEEFDDHETREMILQNSIDRADAKQERLMRGVTSALKFHGSCFSDFLDLPSTAAKPAFPLEKVLHHSPWHMKLAMDRMLSLGYSMEQADASAILRKAFSVFPLCSDGISWNIDRCRSLLSDVISVVRCVATQNVAIPTDCWRLLLVGLAQHGKLDALEQLSLDILRMYDSGHGGLFPVHSADFPQGKDELLATALETEQEDISESTSEDLLENTPEDEGTLEDISENTLEGTPMANYIPSDLSLKHRDHPVAKVFNADFQRITVGRGFSWALYNLRAWKREGSTRAITAAKYNVAHGVHILANLRDRGVVISQNLVRSTARNQIRCSSRIKHQSGALRSRNWPATKDMARLMNAAWGASLFSAKDMDKLTERKWARIVTPINEHMNWLHRNNREMHI